MPHLAASLRVTGNVGGPREYRLDGKKLIIGRDPAAAIRLDDPSASWRHAQLLIDGDEAFIEDLGSVNGSWVNGRRIKRLLLTQGDVIGIGSHELTYQSPPSAPSVASASERTLAAATGADRRHQVGSFSIGRASWYRRWIPLVSWLSGYGLADARADAIAGATVAVMLVPQGMAYAILAGLPPVVGLYACLLPLLCYAVLGGSRQLSVAPVALDSMLLAAGLTTLAVSGTQAYVTLAVTTALLVGLLQVVMGLLRLGFVVNFLSYPVMCGFSSAAALMIAFSQLGNLLNLSLPRTHHLHEIAFQAWAQRDAVHLPTLTMGLGCIAALLALKRWRPAWPGPLLVMLAATLAVIAGGKDLGIPTVGAVPEGLPDLALPGLDPHNWGVLLPLALTLALVGHAQSISVAKTLAQKSGDGIDPDKELIALGAANLGAAVSQGYPVSGGLSRSAVNARAGARTPLAGAVAAVGVGAALLFTGVFSLLPVVALAAVILMAVTGLIDAGEVRHLFRVKRSEGLLVVFTFGATLAFGIMPGLLAGMAASILLHVGLSTRPPTAILGRLPGTTVFRNIANFPDAETIPGLVVLRIDASFYFANAEFLKMTISGILDRPDGPPTAIIIDGSAINDLDSTGDAALRAIAADMRRRRIRLLIAGVKNPVRKVMKGSGAYHLIGAENFYYTIDAAVQRVAAAPAPAEGAGT